MRVSVSQSVAVTIGVRRSPVVAAVAVAAADAQAFTGDFTGGFTYQERVFHAHTHTQSLTGIEGHEGMRGIREGQPSWHSHRKGCV